MIQHYAFSHTIQSTETHSPINWVNKRYKTLFNGVTIYLYTKLYNPDIVDMFTKKILVSLKD